MNSDVLTNSLHNMRNALQEMTTPLSYDPDHPSRIPSAREIAEAAASAPTLRQQQTEGFEPEKNHHELASELDAGLADLDLKPGPTKILNALIQFPDGLTKPQLIALSGYRATSTYEYLRSLIAAGYAEKKQKKFLVTPNGRLALPNAKPLPTGAALREFWKGQLPAGQWSILELLINKYPDGLSKQKLIEGSKYKATSIYEYVRALKACQLVVGETDEYKASKTLF